MTEDASPRVKLPDHITRKPVTPGTNSWAQSQTRAEPTASDHDSPRPTNRERYENKPMPKLPDETTVEVRTPQAKPYIQPAIPLVYPKSHVKDRAVTDPILPKGLFAGQKPSVGQLRQKFSHSKQASVGDKQLSSTFPYRTGKAAEVLGLSPELPLRRDRAPSPDSSFEEDSNGAESPSDAHLGQYRDFTHQGSSIHARKDSQDTVDANTQSELLQDAVAPEAVVEKADMPSRDHEPHKTDHLAPPRVATYGRVGEMGVLQNQGMIRVESVQGIIEDAASNTNSESTPIRDTPTYSHSDFLQPVTYSPNNYAGVWENDPAVVSIQRHQPSMKISDTIQGYSLPPFSPMPKIFAPKQGKEQLATSQTSNATTPSGFHDDYTNASFSSSGFPPRQDDGLTNRQLPRPLEIRQPLGSANSWAQEISSASENDAESAHLPRHWPHRLNPVPSPPHSQRDYDRPGSVAAGLSQLDMTIHHHIDTAFASLSRLIIDKNDRVMDQMLRRIDNFEDAITKSNKNVKKEVKSLSGEVLRTRMAINNFSSGNENIKELMQNLQDKIGSFEKQSDEIRNLCQLMIMQQAAPDLESERQTRSSVHRRTESAHGASGMSRDRQQQRNSERRATSRMRTSKGSSRSHRSNTVSSSPIDRNSDSQGARREQHTDIRSGREPAPDLRKHPAYAGIPQSGTQMYDQYGVPIGIAYAGVPYDTQNLGDGGWYQQAYGSN